MRVSEDDLVDEACSVPEPCGTYKRRGMVAAFKFVQLSQAFQDSTLESQGFMRGQVRNSSEGEKV